MSMLHLPSNVLSHPPNESNNYFVSSRGLMKICDLYSTTPYSSIKRLINYPNLDTIRGDNHNPSPMAPARSKHPTIYICSSAINHFISVLLPIIDFSFILVSGDCDETIPYDIFQNSTELNNFINNHKIIHWFGQNMTIQHSKITSMPIGLDYHTMTGNDIWGGITSTHDQEMLLQSIIKKSKPFWERQLKCYANFHFLMTTKYGYDRVDALNNVNKELVYYEPNKIIRFDTWNIQKEYAFVISPHGGGFDCHRTWEALVLGCISIVKTSKIDVLYEDLPVLIVNNWSDVTSDLLKTTIELYKTRTFKYEKLTLEYWKNKIAAYCMELKENETYS